MDALTYRERKAMPATPDNGGFSVPGEWVIYAFPSNGQKGI